MSTTDTQALTDAEIDDFVRRVYVGQGPLGLMMFCRQLLEANRERDLEAAALALAQPAPTTAAYMTLNEDGDPSMLFFDRAEALGYCEPGEEPIELVRRALPLAGDGLQGGGI